MTGRDAPTPRKYGAPGQTSSLPSKRSLLSKRFIAFGRRPSDVLKEIATKHPSIRNLAGAKAGNLRGTLSGWRKEFRQNRVKNSEASDLFAIGRDLIESRREDAAALREIARHRLPSGKAGVFHRGLTPAHACLNWFSYGGPDNAATSQATCEHRSTSIH